MTERVRIGFSGAGAIAQLAHLPVLGNAWRRAGRLV